MKIYKKIIISMLVISLLLCATYVSAEQNISINENESAEDPVTEYLLDAGYPSDLIDDLDDSTKMEFYNGKYRYQSSSTVYGILTDTYDIRYELDENNNVIMDDSAVDDLQTLLNDEEAVEKIIYDKSKSGVDETDSAISELSVGGFSSLTDISVIQEEDEFNTVSLTSSTDELTNFYAHIICSNISSANNYLEKQLTYSWSWYYAPFWTLTDKIAMAWSDDFNSDPSSIYWTYNAYGQGYDEYLGYYDVYRLRSSSGYGYNEYVPGCGVGKDINIINGFNENVDYNGSNVNMLFCVYMHSGTLSTVITKFFYGINDEASAVGRYYHQIIAFDGTLSFSEVPSIDISLDYCYTQSSDAGTRFWYYK